MRSRRSYGEAEPAGIFVEFDQEAFALNPALVHGWNGSSIWTPNSPSVISVISISSSVWNDAPSSTPHASIWGRKNRRSGALSCRFGDASRDRLASTAQKSECVNVQRYIRTVMETIHPSAQSMPEAEVIELWLRRQRSPATRGAYRRDMNRLLTWAGGAVVDIGAFELECFAEKLTASGLAPISQGRTLAAIRSFFRFAERIGFCRNPASGLQLPRIEPALSERIMSEEDVRRMILLEPYNRNRVLLAVLYTAGLRVSEACSLHWRHLKDRREGGQLLVHGKGGRTRTVVVPAAIWSQIATLKGTAGPDAPVFASRSGKPLERSRVGRIVRDASRRAGISAAVTTHWLRHAHASHALDRGAPIHLVQATLGHRSVATTSLYLHVRPGESSATFLS